MPYGVEFPSSNSCLLPLQIQKAMLKFLNQPFIGKTKVPIITDDDMVQDSNLHNLPGNDQVPGHCLVAAVRFRVS